MGTALFQLSVDELINLLDAGRFACMLISSFHYPDEYTYDPDSKHQVVQCACLHGAVTGDYATHTSITVNKGEQAFA
jgi:hypothetical protein